ncbi:MAG: radical SAM protein [Methanotrichaceae archaeon]|nr:radical SAM protein [Methanotrichaceae archaeon]
MPVRVLFTTIYKNDPSPYDYIGSNSKSKWFRFYWPRIQSFGLRFLKQNIPELQILEFPTWDEFYARLNEGWDVVGISFYLSETQEALDMVETARQLGTVGELWAGNYGALTPEIQSKFDRIFVGYAEHQLAPYFGRQTKELIHPPLIEYLNTVFRIKLNIYGIMFTMRGCSIGCTFCQTPVFCNKPTPIPLESLERLIAYYKEHNINTVLIEDENFGSNREHADRVVSLLDDYAMIWGCMARADYLKYKIPEWVEMRKLKGKNQVAGFGGAAIGIENLHQARLNEIKKKEGKEDILETIQLLQKYDLGTVGYYIIGFEDDTKESLKDDIRRLASLKLDITQICVLTPLPQTPLYDEIVEKYGIWDNDYHHFDGKHLVWNHPNINPKDMDKILDQSLRSVNSWISPIRTSARVWANAYRYAGLTGVKEVASYISQANKFDFSQKRLLNII